MNCGTTIVFSTFVVVAATIAPTKSAHANIVFDWATVRNSGNAPDPATGYGSVSYDYRISKTEVTNAQYVQFLNTVDPAGTNQLALYNSSMGFNGGITFQTGNVNGAKYLTKPGYGNKPVVYASWLDAVRFCNWLQNGSPVSGASTESGAYDLSSFDSDPYSVKRDANAIYFLPTENEWYKAAYHDKNSGTAGNYFLYPTGTNAIPYSDNPASLNTPDNTNVGNFHKNDRTANGYDDGFAVTGKHTYESGTNYFTDVAAYAQTNSPYGTFDQEGNAREWTETIAGIGSVPVLRGGVFSGSHDNARSNHSGAAAWWSESDNLGFRVASVIPEPSTAVLLVFMAGVFFKRQGI